MMSTGWSRTVILTCVLAAALQACGGGGGSGGGGGGDASGTSTPGSAHTNTPAVVGSNTPTVVGINTPTVGYGLPTPSATPTGVMEGSDLREALRNAPPGSTVLVPPGLYPPLILQAGDLQGPVTLLADVLGVTEVVGPVIIGANGKAIAAINLNGVDGLTIDGITAQGGTQEGILVLNSSNIVVRNGVMLNNQGDGIFVEGSPDTQLFDNLVYDNTEAGIRIFGSDGTSLINNTVYGNGSSGISIGSTTEPSSGIFTENNIVNANPSGKGILVETGSSYSGNYNLNTDGYGPNAPKGANDINADPGFASPSTGDFHYFAALDDCTNGSPAVNAGDPATSADLVTILQNRSTSLNSKPDCVGTGCCTAVDLGYHYPLIIGTPTPTPKGINTPTSRPGTATPIRTPTRTHTPGGPTNTPHPPAGTPTPTPNHHSTPTQKPTLTPRH